VPTSQDGVGIDHNKISAPGDQQQPGLQPPSSEEPAVVLMIPNDRSFLRVVRLVVASLAADLEFDYEEVEDLRTAADELVNLVMSGSQPHGNIRLDIFLAERALVVRSSGEAMDANVVDSLDPLGLYVVRAIVDSFDVVVREGRLEAGFQTGPPARFEHA
jgi:anti-sigma regulatory factor (Ser/Thr protein kinase)